MDDSMIGCYWTCSRCLYNHKESSGYWRCLRCGLPRVKHEHAHYENDTKNEVPIIDAALKQPQEPKP